MKRTLAALAAALLLAGCLAGDAPREDGSLAPSPTSQPASGPAPADGSAVVQASRPMHTEAVLDAFEQAIEKRLAQAG